MKNKKICKIANENSKIILITGGARSGKSSFAEKLAADLSNKIAYIATAIPFDEGMKDRIKKHRESRPRSWTTFEIYKDIYKHIEKISQEHDTILLDCVTILVTNLMFDNHEIDWDVITRKKIDEIEKEIKEQVELLIKIVRDIKLNCILVTNELGMGIVPENRLSRIFRDIAGRINQFIASKADEVYFTVSGIPVKIK
ncbi:bifunctional adenosylcobinamide kinase/adenosylcobinamide-phosphate guanylyltransferase [Paramaledivibacter caminithermalis]|uniref:Bifunctional adenosylcobalamin biosynthesis protein CobU n=1 Tax=Paramaledivibacter caminithermalis (strain DSM 15212 / CIP 107654 / DViRD3) TaxID=1121301 RepID=A0A1M6MLU8_PARC5|nr:bifunctional adenosylcobinamide kinase/adenosylcobinamide-phosphate guanylyltransferase [Paramaledivibacter caminithermalis]SHJ84461.1 adenosylcobinamide kinase /adenosylcobinamide-phosphate guanylyltransferase [Paramaledivibacter caminithermalis DSM 15212]